MRRPIPPFLQELLARHERGAGATTSPPISLERFAAATRAVAEASDMADALGRLGLTLDDYMHATRYWVERIAKDDALAETFRRGAGAGKIARAMPEPISLERFAELTARITAGGKRNEVLKAADVDDALVGGCPRSTGWARWRRRRGRTASRSPSAMACFTRPRSHPCSASR